MPRKPVVAVIGDAVLEANSRKWELAEELGRDLVSNGYRIVCGGLGGVMEAVARGARKAAEYKDGDVVGILPGLDPNEANDYVDISLATGLQYARNALIANADAVIAIGGGAGTLSELALAWEMKRLVIAYRVQGWSGELADRRIDERRRLDNIPDDRVYGVASSSEAIGLLAMLDAHRNRSLGIRKRKPSRD